jgi:hypothetical protein
VLLRIGNLRGVDLSIFDFDYDLQWHAFFLTPDAGVLGRFGGRDPDEAGKYHSLAALRHSLESALAKFKKARQAEMAPRKSIRPEDYPAAARLGDSACIHCHHVHEFRRGLLQRDKQWSLDNVWMYPQPENIGLTLDIERGDRVLNVLPKSPAARIGISAKDVVRKIGVVPIASAADVQFALNLAPKTGALPIEWQSGPLVKKGVLLLPDDWRKTDVSWRWSLKSMSPNPSLIGDDLGLAERKTLGLEPRQLAYRHMNFLTPTARHAGLQGNDVIVGIGDQMLTMTARQFETHIRLNYRVGDEITLNVLRGKERVKIKLKLPE